MALPKQIQKQIKDSEEFHTKVYATPPVEDDDKEPEKAEEAIPEEKVEAKPEAKPDESFEKKPEAKEVTSNVSPTEAEKPATDFEKQYKVLQGKYNAEVPRLNREVAQLQGQIISLQNLLAQMQSQPAVSDKEDDERQPAGQTSRLIKPEEIDDFGEDLIDVVGRRAQEVVSPELQALRKELAELRTQFGVVETANVQSRTEKVHDLLNHEVENWQGLNTDAGFLDWLEQPDPYSGNVRRELLQRAYQNGDGPRVVRFFKGYLNENAAMTAPVPNGQAGTPRQPKIDTEDLVSPGKARQASSGAPQDKRTWTRKEISAFYDDVRRGAFRGKPEQQQKLEREIILAGQEGRIR